MTLYSHPLSPFSAKVRTALASGGRRDELEAQSGPHALCSERAAQADPAAFVQKFVHYWSAPSIEGMTTLLTEDVVLIQPLTPPMRGLAQAQARFAAIFRSVPDMRAEVDDWCAKGSRLFIDFRLSGSYGGEHIEWPAIDRITLRGDSACERISYFDPSPIVRAIARHPTTWVAAFRSLFLP